MGLNPLAQRNAPDYSADKLKTKPRTEVGCRGIILLRMVQLCFRSRLESRDYRPNTRLEPTAMYLNVTTQCLHELSERKPLTLVKG